MKPSLWKRMEPYVKTICAKCICILLVLFLVMIYIKSESLKESLEDYGEKRSTFHAPLAYEVLAADLREPEFSKKKKTFVELTEKGKITNTSITEDPSYNAEKLVEKMISSDENSKIERTTDIIKNIKISTITHEINVDEPVKIAYVIIPIYTSSLMLKEEESTLIERIGSYFKNDLEKDSYQINDIEIFDKSERFFNIGFNVYRYFTDDLFNMPYYQKYYSQSEMENDFKYFNNAANLNLKHIYNN